MQNEIILKPIGFVRTSATDDDIHTDRPNVVSNIVLDEHLEEALDGIEGYSHLLIIFWMHLVPKEERARVKTHPRHRTDLPQVGVFAARGRGRPNPIGLAVVEVLERRRNVLKVKGLDALDGTAVLDVKPYDYIDVKENIRVPDWWYKAHPKRNEQKCLDSV